MIQEKPSNNTLHETLARMSEQDAAVIGSRSLNDLMDSLDSIGIKCHARITTNEGEMFMQIFARVGDNVVPIGHKKSLKNPPQQKLETYTLSYYLKNVKVEYSYDIVASSDEEATTAAEAYLAPSFNLSSAILVDENEEFVWESYP